MRRYTKINSFIIGDQQITNKDIISSYNFARSADVVVGEKLPKQNINLLDPENFSIINEDNESILYLNKKIRIFENDLVFINPYFVEIFFEKIKNIKDCVRFKLLTTQTDIKVSKKAYHSKPSCVTEWFATNVDFKSKNLHPIPLGLSNYPNKNLTFKNYVHGGDQLYTKNNKVYVNFEVNTNYFHRSKILKNLQNDDFYIVETENLNLTDYLAKLRLNKFILTPWGNGFDTHRFWETLYAGSIPIVQDHITYDAGNNLPVIKIQNYNFKGLKFLEDKLSEIKNLNYEKLKIGNWVQFMKGDTHKNNGNYFDVIFSDTEIQTIIKKHNHKLLKESNNKRLKTLIRKSHKLIFENE